MSKLHTNTAREQLFEYIAGHEYINIFLINIDNFNNINAFYGFEIGDMALQNIMKMLMLSKPNTAELFHLGADEFALVSLEHLSITELGNIASSIVSFFDQMEFELPNLTSIKTSLSIGVANGKGCEVVNHAKTAISEMRQFKRGSYNIYDPESSFVKQQEKNIYWINRIKEAFENEQLKAFYQPIFNTRTMKIEKYESLARIYDDTMVTTPINFLKAAESTGTLPLITKVIIEQSFSKFSKNNMEFSVNITNSDLYLGYLEEFLVKHATKYNIKPSRVVLEILEDIDTLNTPEILYQLARLRQAGFKIAIDDFGSRSSNFSRLLEFRPDYLKIDGTFIKNILTDQNSLIIVETIVALCRKSDIKVIAEFVSSKEIADKLIEIKIDYLQGYFIGEPKAELLDA